MDSEHFTRYIVFLLYFIVFLIFFFSSYVSCLVLFLLPFSQNEGDVIVCNAISGRDFRFFMHMRTVCGLLVDATFSS